MALDTNDEWYETEESTRRSMISEVQRIRRRTVVRPIPVLLMAALLTGAIVYKVATKKRIVEAEIVLALTEGTMSADERDVGIPVNDLRNYVAGQLMPKSKLAEIIERRDLFRLRKKMGIDYAIDELRENIEVQIWHNSFLLDDETGGRSARIGITYGDKDPDLALEIARDLAQVVVQEQNAKQQDTANKITQQLNRMRADLAQKLVDLRKDQAAKQVEHDRAVQRGQRGIAEAMDLRDRLARAPGQGDGSGDGDDRAEPRPRRRPDRGERPRYQPRDRGGAPPGASGVPRVRDRADRGGGRPRRPARIGAPHRGL